MSLLPIVLAADTLDELIPTPTPWYRLSASMREYLAIFGAITLVTLLAVLWAIYLRKRRRGRSHHHGHHHSSEGQSGGAPVRQAAESEAASGKRRWHRRRRAHRPRNPTLAETGGLPPLREEQPPEPFP